MKWQKNTGVMPCDKYDVVTTRDNNGTIRLRKYRAELVNWKGTNVNHTYYIHKVDDVPENDYVEPKVWTVEFNYKGHCFNLNKHGQQWMILDTTIDAKALHIADALNAMENAMERSEAIRALAQAIDTLRNGDVLLAPESGADYFAEAVRTLVKATGEHDRKARYDRYVCAVLTGNYNQQPFKIIPPDEVAALALDAMLAADKRWEEYTKGETP